MKKIVLSAVAVILALALAGCSFTSTVTRTETVTDANGRTTTHTSTTTNDNGQITTSETVEVVEASDAAEATEASQLIVATIAFDNETGLEISGMYFSTAQDDNWGDNLFANANPLPNETIRTFENGLTYDSEHTVWDMKIDDGNVSVDFRGLDMTAAADPQNIQIIMTHNAEDNTYSVRVE